MNSDQILSLLDGVRDNRGGNYMARCPAHDDRSPSLSVKFCADGRVLLHCFAGCAIEAVCDSIGVTLADLMPPAPLSHRKRQVRSKMPAGEALKSLDYESLVVAVIASDIHRHREVDEPTLDRLLEAATRIGRARDAVAPRRHKI